MLAVGEAKATLIGRILCDTPGGSTDCLVITVLTHIVIDITW